MTQRSSNRYSRWLLLSQFLWTVPLAQPAFAQVQLPPNFISPVVPHDVPTGSAASITDLAIFAWREFIALNWPSVDPATTGQRGRANGNADFLSIKKDGEGSFPLLVWQTYRHKNELFPADGKTDPKFDSSKPTYKYKGPPITAGDSNPTMELFNNLDESSQIGLCTMFSHTSIRIVYEAKVSRALFDYANKNGLTTCDGKSCPTLDAALTKTSKNLAEFGGLCSADPSIVSLPCGDAAAPGDAGEGAIEIKAAWRQLTQDEINSGRFYTRKVLFYTGTQFVNQKYQNAVYGLVALHIIHKTKSFPTFVFATWEQVDNYDDRSNQNSQQLVFQNTGTALPNIPVKREHPIHSQIPPVNDAVHAAFSAKDPGTIWQYYKLIGVQGRPVNGPPPPNTPIDDLSYYYLANIVVETNQTLQNFFGKLSEAGTVESSQDVYLKGAAGSPFQMGGCKGCHGAAGQTAGGDMSVLLASAPSNSTHPPESVDASAVASVKSYLQRSLDALRRQ